jgi:outer membrane protein OmpA-like peptidoglycan-associated protein/opacity protein-like surface antigen
MYRKTLCLLIIGLTVMTFSVLNAQNWTLGFKGGASLYIGDVDDQQYLPYGGMSLEYWIIPQVSLGLMGYGTQLQGEENEYYFETRIYSLAALARIRPFGQTPVSPYLLGGVEGYIFEPKDGSGNKMPNNEAGLYKKERIGVPVGGGISSFILDNLSIDLEALYHFALTDYLDDISLGKGDDGYYTASLGLSIHFGQAKDTDGDGILDKNDLDPLRPEDYDGFEDEDGAPDLDNDQDGVPDELDKAPMQPEDRDGFQDEDGVPDPDNDGDGILDVDDLAPNEPEDVDNFQDKDGAPDPDNDQDGILDPNDQCPGTDATVADSVDTKETYNDYEDKDGCPDKKPEIAVEKGESIILEGVYFTSGSAYLTANSRFVLDKVVRTLQANKDIEVEIRGYTDNTGRYETNMRLSQQRADAVKIYLMNNGIDAYRIRTKGFGPENPIAPNSTREGRSKNRRIEFFRIK